MTMVLMDARAGGGAAARTSIHRTSMLSGSGSIGKLMTATVRSGRSKVTRGMCRPHGRCSRVRFDPACPRTGWASLIRDRPAAVARTASHPTGFISVTAAPFQMGSPVPSQRINHEPARDSVEAGREHADDCDQAMEEVAFIPLRQSVALSAAVTRAP